jgi:Phosphatidate cytidylyltransferase, mitochondrial
MEKLKYNLVAGRLAKPTRLIWGQPKPESVDEYRVVLDLINRNYERSLAYGRLSFHYKKLVKKPLMDNMILMALKEAVFSDLISLSYIGDVRRIFGAEDPNKIQNIYKGNQTRLEETYAPHLKKYEGLGFALIQENKAQLIKEGNSGLATLLEKRVLTPQQQEILSQQSLSQALLHEELFPHEREHLEKVVHPKILHSDLASILQGPTSLAGEFIRSSLRMKNFWMSSRLVVSQLSTSPILTNLTYLLQKLRKGILKRK